MAGEGVRDDTREYYERRAPEYDETSWGALDPEHRAEAGDLERVVAALGPGRVLDVGCGTGFLSPQLGGRVVGVDASASMLAVARGRVPGARLVQAAVPPLPFRDRSFDRVFTAHFFGHLREEDRVRFLAEAARVGSELVVVDSAVQPGFPVEGWEERQLRDGSRYRIFKRHFTPEGLAEEVGGGTVLFAGRAFVAVASRSVDG